MIMLMNDNLKENVRFYFLFNIITLVFLIWIHHPYDYKYDFDRALEKKSKPDSIIDIDLKRLLAQNEFKKLLDHSSLSKNLPGYSKFKEIKNEKKISTYGQVKKGKANDLDVYKKEYKNRYSKKKGLAKLDCYFEKKIFDKIEHVHHIAKKFVDDKKSYKKEIYSKYGYILIILGLIPLLGLVIPILFWGPDKGKALINFCRHHNKDKHNGDEDCKHAYIISYDNGESLKALCFANTIILNYLFPILILLIFIYIFIKIVKYELLKSGKSKINRKDYINFCKDLFKNY